MENCKLIILRGNSGSGKSSVARELQHRFGRGTLMIPQDEVRTDQNKILLGCIIKNVRFPMDVYEIFCSRQRPGYL